MWYGRRPNDLAQQARVCGPGPSAVSRIFRYILVHDYGIAPCPADDLLTLATCKPSIRRSAKPGDWVLGFRPGTVVRGEMLWGGRVARVMTQGEFEQAYRGRPDALYRLDREGSFSRLNPAYHPSEREKARDLSGPVLLFDESISRYCYGQPVALPSELAHLAPIGRGHRVNGVNQGDPERLAAWLTALPRTKPVRELAESLGCHRTSSCAMSAAMPMAGLSHRVARCSTTASMNSGEENGTCA